MNAEQTLRAVLADEAATMRPSADGLARIERRASRRRRPGWLVPALAGMAVLALVAVVLPALRRPQTLGPADSLYRREGVVWPFATTADAQEWRRFPEGAPYLADPESAAREFVRRILLPDGDVEPVDGGWAVRSSQVRMDGTIVVRPGPDGAAPYVVVAVRSDQLSIDVPDPVRNGDPVTLRGTKRESASVRFHDRYGLVGGEEMNWTGGGWTGRARFDETPRTQYGAVVARLVSYGERAAAVAAVPVRFAEHRALGPASTDPPVPVMYAIDGQQQLVEVDTATGAVRRVLTPAHPETGPSRLEVAGRQLYYDHPDQCGTIHVVSLADGSDRELIRLATAPAVSPDRSRLAYLRTSCAPDALAVLVVRDLRTGVETVVPGGARIRAAHEPRWTPDNRSLLFTAWPSATPGAPLAPVALDVGAARSLDDARLLPEPVEPGCTFSGYRYGGDRLLALRQCRGGADVVVLDAATGAVRESLLHVPLGPDGTGHVEHFDVDATGRHAVTSASGREFLWSTFYGPARNWIPGNYRSAVW